ncbi:MAG: hypothetical protein OEZ59_11650 [Deltaproteobacteria bacterium]|nr:hypothetical protein [Deltaproteobacteria bacterium]
MTTGFSAIRDLSRGVFSRNSTIQCAPGGGSSPARALLLLTALLAILPVLAGCGGGDGGGKTSGRQSTVLTIGANHSDSLPAWDGVSNPPSDFFSFTTGSAADSHQITVSPVTGSLTWHLFTSRDFLTSTMAYAYDGIECAPMYGATTAACGTPVLKAGRTYYLWISNFETETKEYTVLVETGGTPEGLIVTVPEILQLGVLKSMTYQDGMDNFFRFVTSTTPGTYTISLTNTSNDLSWALFEDPFLFAYLGHCDTVFAVGDESCRYSSLDPTTAEEIVDYYIMVEKWDALASGTYDIKVEMIPLP